jgi:hypothetical protein
METTMTTEGRAKPILVALALTVALGANGAEARAQEALYLVHYAQPDRAKNALTDAGKERAKALARMLIDAGIDVIYSAALPWVVQTAEPTAKALNIKINVLPLRNTKDKIDDVVRPLLTQHAKGRVFMALGSPGIQHILGSLGLPHEEVYRGRTDNLYIIIPRLPQEPLVIKMRW